MPIPVPQSEPLPVAVAEPASQMVAIEPVPAQAAQPQADVTITQEMLAAIYLRNPKPGYPNLSRRLREQGTVQLRVFVTVAGDPTKVELKSSSGFSRLDRAAHDAVQRWKFVPARRGDQPVDAWVIVPIKFSLKG
jgi:protein TonB